MSRSIPEAERSVNPAKLFLEFNGAEGVFEYFDKNATNPDPNKKGVKFKIPLPFNFLVLDQLSTITGYNDQDKSGIYSNEIRNRGLKTDILIIRTKEGEKVRGIYDYVKGKVSGMDYAKSVYIAYFGSDKKLAIGNIKMSGAALNAWIEFCKDKEVTKGYICASGCTDHVKGVVHYKMPVFEQKTISKPELDEEANVLDTQLQAYLTAYFDFYTNEPVVGVTETTAVQAQTNTNQNAGASRSNIPAVDEFGMGAATPVVQQTTPAVQQHLGNQNDFLGNSNSMVENDLPF